MGFQPLLFNGFVLGQSSGGGGGSPTIGGPVVGGTTGSVLFVGPSSTLTQDHANFNFNDSTHALTITGVLSASNITGSISGTSSGTNTGDITLGTTNGLSLAGQVLSLQLSSTSTAGALSSTDWNTFNSKQATLTFNAPLTDISNVVSIPQATTSVSGYLSSTDWNTFNNKQPAGSYVTTSEVGAANGVASLDGSGKVPIAQLPNAILEYQGGWNPNTNTPTLNDGTGTNGYVYYVTAADSGTVAGLSDPSMVNFQIGNLIIYSGSVSRWQQTTPAAGVVSVNGMQGAVVLTRGNLTDSTSGADGITVTGGTNAVWGSGTSVAQQVANTSQNGYLLSTDWNTFNSKQSALTFTSPLINTAGTITIQQANSSQSGYLSSTDWNTFNNKQASGLALLLAGGSPTGPITSSSTITASNISGSTSGTNTGDQTITLTGAVTGSGTGSFATTLTNTSVTGQLLTGFVSGPDSPVLATDSILQGLQKLQAEVNSTPIVSPGDINEMSFSAANNQSSPANVTGFAFSNAVVRSFKALVSVYINASSPLYEVFDIQGIQRAADWQMSVVSTGDSSGIVFSITTSGQIQYTSTNISGFVTDKISFRAITTSV